MDQKFDLDTLDPDRFAAITRWGRLPQVLDGIRAAQDAGLRVKINAVALKDDNAGQLADMIAWAHARDMEMTLIETMPLGEIEADRTDQFLSLAQVRSELERRWTLTPMARRTGGPAQIGRAHV